MTLAGCWFISVLRHIVGYNLLLIPTHHAVVVGSKMAVVCGITSPEVA